MSVTYKITRSAWWLAAAAALLSACSTPAEPPVTVETAAAPVRVIVDTDLGIDVDDAGALAVLHTLADQGEARILATVSNVNDPYAVAAIDTINTYYGRPDIPLGRNPREGHYSVATAWWRSHRPRFVRDMAERFPHDSGSSPASAVSVYRRTLASQPDGSVTVISLGFLQNLADLLDSDGDRYSSLSGRELVRRKVKQLVIMGGTYPGSDRDLYLTGGRDISPRAAIRVLDSWPTRTVFTPGSVCGGFKNGHTLARETPSRNPVRYGYTRFFGHSGEGRQSWDLCTVLYAVRGSSHDGERYFRVHEGRRLTLKTNDQSRWVSSSSDRHLRVSRAIADYKLRAKLEALMTRDPRN